jgi:hypothetical protein
MSATPFTVVSFYAVRDRLAAEGVGDLSGFGARVTERDVWRDLGGLAEHLRRAGAQCPRVLPANSAGWTLPPVEIRTGSICGAPVIQPDSAVEWTAWLLAVPYTGFVLVLEAEACGGLDTAIDLLNHAFYRRRNICVCEDASEAGLPLIAWVNRRVAEESAGPRSTPPRLRLDLDAHQMLMLPSRELLGGEHDADDALLRRALFRGEDSRESYARVIRPMASNRPPETVVALRTSVSVVARVEEHLVAGLQLSTAQSLAGLARSREIRRTAYRALGEARLLAGDVPEAPEARRQQSGRHALTARRATVEGLSRALGTSEYELSFGVRANSDIGLVLPVAEVTEYHSAMAEILGTDRGLQVSEALLSSLARTIETARATTAGLERERDERVQRIWAAFAAALLVPGLVAAIFGANVSLPGKETWWGTGLLLGLIALTVTATVALYRALEAGSLRKRRAPGQSPRH